MGPKLPDVGGLCQSNSDKRTTRDARAKVWGIMGHSCSIISKLRKAHGIEATLHQHPSINYSAPSTPATYSTFNMANQNPFQEYMNKMSQVARTGRGFPGGKGPRGLVPALTAVGLIASGIYVANHALFNVEGGHRAIKYKRLTGVSKEIYREGASGLADQPSDQIRGTR